ncbi:sigma 54-interacting transcriptional regulator [Synechococcus sp. Nb3U1]|uniref:sigma 54-interacting transcriptional regulator n=1 Tax=Synechococcus sp. Nb3U1 TaxID=1914529 RepID=UPI001F33B2ED|nr:sigma 54-interacting transcriptional regulator [Synechococcus sp. Nb3U1]MCF2970590.1 sigma 54-interacting transcriptional regulator [Synechococcus sp. Nb3U1]
MTPAERAQWLKNHTLFQALSLESLYPLAEQMQEHPFQQGQALAEAGTVPDGIQILIQGRMDSVPLTRREERDPLSRVSLLPGSVVGLAEVLAEQPLSRSVIALSNGSLGWIPAAAVRAWAAGHPQVATWLSNRVEAQELAEALAQMTARLTYEQERQVALRPYLVPKVERGIVGPSRYAVRLRQQVKEAAHSREPILIFGEPGLEKDNIAALIHFGSPYRRQPMIKLDCSALQSSGADLFGRAGGKPGLLEWLGEGTLLLNNIQELPAELMPKILKLLETGSYTPVQRGESEPALDPRPYRCRILMVSERVIPALEPWVTAIKVPPLRVRKADIKAKADYFLSLYTRRRGIPKPSLAPEALRRLQSYDYPGNSRELRNLIERAVVQAAGAPVLNEEVFWAPQPRGKQFRLNLLNAYPSLRKFLRSPWWTDRLNYGLVLPTYTLVVFLLFWGPQDRAHNVGLNLFWAWWWPLVLLVFPVLGRVWCAVCPFMIYGELVQKLSLWLWPRQLGKWPRQSAERWGGWVLFAGFALIFLWEEIWDLPNTAYLSAWLLLLITGGAVVCSLLFERRFWCRYLCPIGGMNGLYAKLSITELRAQQGTCSAECTTYQCYKGGPQKGEGLETGGCPLYSHPAQLQDNKDCVLCMTCLKACPHRSVEFNLRPPGIELWTTHTPRPHEVALLLLLLGGIYLHCLPQVLAWIEQVWGLSWDLQGFWPHLAAALLALGIPSVVPVLAYGLTWLQQGMRKGKGQRGFAEMIYGYLPLVLGGTLAFYWPLFLTEAGQILPVTWATFGQTGSTLPTWTAHPAVIDFLQGSTLIVALVLSWVLIQKIARQGWQWLSHLGALVLTVSLWQVLGI